MVAGTEGGGNAGRIPELKSHTRDITVMLKHAGTRLQRLGPQPRTSNACTALRNDFATHHALTTESELQAVPTRRLKRKTHAASAGHAALAGAEASLANPFGCFSVEAVGAVFEAPAAVALHLAARDEDGSLLSHSAHYSRNKATTADLVLVCIFTWPAARKHLDQVSAGR